LLWLGLVTSQTQIVHKLPQKRINQ